MRTAIHDVAARGFPRAVDDYERGRPGYPPEAVARLVEALASDRAGACSTSPRGPAS